jgi:hypothetical protein
MNSWFLKGMLAAAVALPALSGTAWAGGSDDFGCSNATLKGEYAFGVTNYVGNPIVVVAVSRFLTATVISPSVITAATVLPPSSHRQGKKRALTR